MESLKHSYGLKTLIILQNKNRRTNIYEITSKTCEHVPAIVHAIEVVVK